MRKAIDHIAQVMVLTLVFDTVWLIACQSLGLSTDFTVGGIYAIGMTVGVGSWIMERK